MKKVDVIRMIASMPDETRIYFDDGKQVITIDRAELIAQYKDKFKKMFANNIII